MQFDQGDPRQDPAPSNEAVPDLYADGGRIAVGLGGVTLVVTRTRPSFDGAPPLSPEPVVRIRMSPFTAQALAELLDRAVATLRDEIDQSGGRLSEVVVETSQPRETAAA